MDTVKRNRLLPVSIFFCIWFILSGCGQKLEAPSQVPPVLIPASTSTNASNPTPTLAASPQPSIPTETPLAPEVIFPSPTPTCIDGLTFIGDVTIPDDSLITPGITIDKQWLVQNSGSCNWDNRYRLRLINGAALGASTEQALFPARAGMQATLQIFFVAPLEPGEYLSEWQVFDPMGIPFGDVFYIKFIVQQ
jgi:hypothetical protein